MKKLICITCPKGCHLTVDDATSDLVVSGNECKRGITYAQNELFNPKRVITSTVRINNAIYNQIPVKTKDAVPKDKIFLIMQELKKITLTSPIKTGDVVIENVLNTKVDIVATRDL